MKCASHFSWMGLQILKSSWLMTFLPFFAFPCTTNSCAAKDTWSQLGRGSKTGGILEKRNPNRLPEWAFRPQTSLQGGHFFSKNTETGLIWTFKYSRWQEKIWFLKAEQAGRHVLDGQGVESFGKQQNARFQGQKRGNTRLDKGLAPPDSEIFAPHFKFWPFDFCQSHPMVFPVSPTSS